MTLPLRTADEGVVVPVRVIPRSSRTQLAEIRDGWLLARLTAPPVDGAANEALIRLLAKELGMPRRAVRIVSGEHGRQKSVLIEGATAEELLEPPPLRSYGQPPSRQGLGSDARDDGVWRGLDGAGAPVAGPGVVRAGLVFLGPVAVLSVHTLERVPQHGDRAFERGFYVGALPA